MAVKEILAICGSVLTEAVASNAGEGDTIFWLLPAQPPAALYIYKAALYFELDHSKIT